MSRFSIQTAILWILLLPGCISDYIPDEEEVKTGTLVVQAHLTGKQGVQSIRISRSSTLIYPEFVPVSDCRVEVESLSGQFRQMNEDEPGNYKREFDQEFFRRGEHYRLNFITPEGEFYASEFECLQPSPGIDSIYYVREYQSGMYPDDGEDGIRFYIDFEIEKDSGQYLRWQLIETYEIHNPENEAWIFDVDRQLKNLPLSDSWRTCWITNEMENIYTLDMGNVAGDVYKKRPLNHVSTSSRRLLIKYSLLVRQLSVSQSAFRYWDELAKNVQSNGELFDSQPALTPSNICNVNEDNEIVIGYFSISGVSEARIFVEEVPGLKVSKDPLYCAPGEYPKFLSRFPVKYLPVYLTRARVNGERVYGEVHKYCVDCREYRGSTHLKPDFW